MLLRGECVQDLRGDGGAPQRRRRGGAGQGLGGVREQQEASGAAVEAEGGQGRGEARHLGLPRHPHLQTRPQARPCSVFTPDPHSSSPPILASARTYQSTQHTCTSPYTCVPGNVGHTFSFSYFLLLRHFYVNLVLRSIKN